MPASDAESPPSEPGPLLQVVGDLVLPRSPLPIPCHVQGWAWGPAEVECVTVTVDDVVYHALHGLPSLDVVEALRIPEARYAAFFLALGEDRLPPGPRRITVEAIDRQGRSSTWTRETVALSWPSETGVTPVSPSPVPAPSSSRRATSLLVWARDLYTRAWAEVIAARAQDYEADVRLASAMIRLRDAGLECPGSLADGAASPGRPGFRTSRRAAVELGRGLRRRLAALIR